LLDRFPVSKSEFTMVTFVSRARLCSTPVIGGARPLYPAKIGAFFRPEYLSGRLSPADADRRGLLFCACSDLIVRGQVHRPRPRQGPVPERDSAIACKREQLRVSDDTYAVQIHDVARRGTAVERKTICGGLLGRPEGDLITRFPGIGFGARISGALQELLAFRHRSRSTAQAASAGCRSRHTGREDAQPHRPARWLTFTNN